MPRSFSIRSQRATTKTNQPDRPRLPQSADEPVDDGRCFACGSENPIGLHLRFEVDEDGAICETTLADHFQGWRGVAHGGIVMALIDEAMAYAASSRGWKGVTGECTTRFRRPVPLGEPITLRGRVAWERRNVLGVEAEILDGAGTLLASGAGKFVGKGRIKPGELGR